MKDKEQRLAELEVKKQQYLEKPKRPIVNTEMKMFMLVESSGRKKNQEYELKK